ncbi:MAG: 3-dehydroquinate synthase [Thermomicrobiales bacterium]|nr:3-dehydroquinate synthase [Thermomicrobiales bacterium]
MQPIHQHVRVDFRYSVHFTDGLFALDNPLLRDVLAADRGDAAPPKVLVVLDRGIAAGLPGLPTQIAAYLRASDAVELVAPPLLVAGGEAVKNDPSAVAALRQAIHDHGIDRHSYVVAIGGGAVLDAAGYAAATAHRGIRLVRVPTTVLSQNDSGVGVKNGVNAFGKKNFLGTFAPPSAVLNDFAFLETLNERDWRSGIAEAIKVSLLKDAAFFTELEARADALAERDMTAMRRLVYRCAELHLQHIATSGDPFEMGSSRPLDFGHWAAHKLEQITNYELRHGEAVAVGLALDATYSRLVGLLPEADWRRVLALIAAVGLPTYHPALETPVPGGRRAVLAGLDEFREHLGGQLTIMLLEGIGRGREVHAMDEATILAAIALLGEDRGDPSSSVEGGMPWLETPSVLYSPSAN